MVHFKVSLQSAVTRRLVSPFLEWFCLATYPVPEPLLLHPCASCMVTRFTLIQWNLSMVHGHHWGPHWDFGTSCSFLGVPMGWPLTRRSTVQKFSPYMSSLSSKRSSASANSLMFSSGGTRSTTARKGQSIMNLLQ